MGISTITKFLGAGAVAALLVLGVPAMASAADPGYPGATSSTAPPPTTTATGSTTPLTNGQTISIAVGNGATTVSLAGFTPGTTVTVMVNGQAVNVAISTNGTGSAVLTVTVTDPHISINGGSPIPANYGSNAIAVAGTGANGTALTQTIYVNIPNSGAAAGTSGSGSSLAFTGTDIAATVVGGLALLAAGTMLVIFTRRRAGQQHA